MTDYFALFDEARRPWLDPEKLKEKYFARSRTAAANAELNEAFRVLSDPKLRLHHFLVLEGANLTAGRPVPPSVADLFWKTGTLLREVERWLLRNAEAGSALSRALLSSEKTKLEGQLDKLQEQLNALYETELAQLRQVDAVTDPAPPNELLKLIERYDSISYLTRLQEQTREQRFRMSVA
jgi:curved DNA-binding protein CbpA